MSSTTSMDFTLDPISMKQTMEVDDPRSGKQETETYATKDGYFSSDNNSTNWRKYPDDVSNQFLS